MKKLTLFINFQTYQTVNLLVPSNRLYFNRKINKEHFNILRFKYNITKSEKKIFYKEVEGVVCLRYTVTTFIE